MKQLLLFIVLISALNLSAQDTTYTIVYENAEFNSTKQITSAVALDGGLITTSNLIGQTGDVTLLRTHPDGSILWEKRYSGYASPEGIFINDIIATFDTCYIASGILMDNGANYYPFCMKVDDTGTVVWVKSFDFATPISGNYDVLIDQNPYVYETKDSSILMAWHHSTYASSGTVPDHLCISKIASDGNLLFENSIEVDSTFYVSDVVENYDESIFVLGNTDIQNGSGYVVHLTDSGLFDWAKRYDDVELDEIIVDSSGFAISWMDWDQQESGIMKMSSGGINTKRIGFNHWTYDVSTSFDRRDNGNYLFSKRGDNYGGGLFFEVNDTLELVSSHAIMMVIQTVRSIPNYGMYAIGYGPIYGVKTVENEIGVVRFDSLLGVDDAWCSWIESINLDQYPIINGQTVYFANADSISTTLGTIDEHFTSSDSHMGCVTFWGSVSEIPGTWNETVSPNPSSGQFTINWNEYRDSELVVYNALGSKVYQARAKNSFVEIDLQSENDGVYYYQLTDSNGSQSKGKLVLMK